MTRRSKKGILILIVLLAIGFAAVTTALYINGTIRIGSNPDNFVKGLVFTSARIEQDNTEESTSFTTLITQIGEEGVSVISFKVGDFKNIGEYVTVHYTITNKSQYIADIEEISCLFVDSLEEAVALEDEAPRIVGEATNSYIRLTPSEIAGELNPQAQILGEIKVEMIRSYIGTNATPEYEEDGTEKDEKLPLYVKCTINAQAKEHRGTTSEAEEDSSV